ncbi:MAG: helix-turn-helix domain-containing protein [bacterium]|nr:helix-turn-helix domain-containing protein [bacterium]
MQEIHLLSFMLAIICSALIYSENKKRRENRLLKALMVSISVNMLICVYSGLQNIAERQICRITFLFMFLYGPLIYFYVKSVMDERFSFKRIHFLHFFPFALCFLIYSAYSIDLLLIPENIYGQIAVISSFLAFVYLLISIVLYCFQYLSGLPQRAEAESGRLGWSREIIIVFTPAFFVSLILGIMELRSEESFYHADIPVLSASILFSGLYFFYLMKYPQILVQSGYSGEKANGNGNEPEYRKSGLDEEEAGNILADLENYMEIEKPYLDEDLTIHDISKDLGIPRHHITQVINKILRKNFYAFVNGYRVREFKCRLSEPENNHFKLMAIAYESGFKSKSGFYSAFKKIENMTPSEYKETVLNDN